jgi:hypothetical protein
MRGKDRDYIKVLPIPIVNDKFTKIGYRVFKINLPYKNKYGKFFFMVI